MIKAVIIDDERHCINRLAKLLKDCFAGTVEMAGEFTSVEEALQKVPAINPDLVFLDVEINDKTGFDFLKSLHQPGFEVIFTTGYDKYAFQAFKFSAVDYLLKPISTDDLKTALAKLTLGGRQKQHTPTLEVLQHNFRAKAGASKKLCLPNLNGFDVVDLSEIVYCESEGNYTKFFIQGRQMAVTVSKTLKEFDDMLTDFNFFRIHNSYLVNLAQVKSYKKGKGGVVVMTNGQEIEVSTRRKDDFLRRMGEL